MACADPASPVSPACEGLRATRCWRVVSELPPVSSQWRGMVCERDHDHIAVLPGPLQCPASRWPLRHDVIVAAGPYLAMRPNIPDYGTLVPCGHVHLRPCAAPGVCCWR